MPRFVDAFRSSLSKGELLALVLSADRGMIMFRYLHVFTGLEDKQQFGCLLTERLELLERLVIMIFVHMTLIHSNWTMPSYSNSQNSKSILDYFCCIPSPVAKLLP
jgi:hypothetical protein